MTSRDESGPGWLSCETMVRARVSSFLATLLLGGCSCRELPTLPTGSGGAGASGGAPPCEGVDFTTDEDHCGGCGQPCRDGVECVGSACRIKVAADGAFALALDSQSSANRLFWGHGSFNVIEVSSIMDLADQQTLGNDLAPWEIVGVDTSIGMFSMLVWPSVDPALTTAPRWFPADAALPPVATCPPDQPSQCAPATDFASSSEWMVWTGPSGTYFRLPSQPFPSFIDQPATSVAYQTSPTFHAAFAGNGGPGPLPIRWTSDLAQVASTSLPPLVGGETVFLPKNMLFVGSNLFWITPDQRVACADLSLATPSVITYAVPPAGPTALESRLDRLYVALSGGTILQGHGVCAAQAELSVLVSHSLSAPIVTATLAVSESRLFFTRFGTTPESQEAYGGVYERPTIWPAFSTLDVSP